MVAQIMYANSKRPGPAVIKHIKYIKQRQGSNHDLGVLCLPLVFSYSIFIIDLKLCFQNLEFLISETASSISTYSEQSPI